MNKPAQIFISYSHKDMDYCQALSNHMVSLERQGLVSTWYDGRLKPGEEWQKEILSNLECADIILLLISSDFIASDFCWEKEMAKAIENHINRKTRLVPIIVRPVNWKKAPFARIQALPQNGKPISTWENQDEAYLNIIEGIGTIIETECNKQKEDRTDERNAINFNANDILNYPSPIINWPNLSSTPIIKASFENINWGDHTHKELIINSTIKGKDIPIIGTILIGLANIWKYIKEHLTSIFFTVWDNDTGKQIIIGTALALLAIFPPVAIFLVKKDKIKGKPILWGGLIFLCIGIVGIPTGIFLSIKYPKTIQSTLKDIENRNSEISRLTVKINSLYEAMNQASDELNANKLNTRIDLLEKRTDSLNHVDRIIVFTNGKIYLLLYIAIILVGIENLICSFIMFSNADDFFQFKI
jgi:hypothetical protein